AKIIAESAGHSASDQITSRTMESEIGPKRNPYSDSAFSGRALNPNTSTHNQCRYKNSDTRQYDDRCEESQFLL
ncbi:hypothetical protein, partial [Rhizobium sp. LEGMi135b]